MGAKAQLRGTNCQPKNLQQLLWFLWAYTKDILGISSKKPGSWLYQPLQILTYRKECMYQIGFNWSQGFPFDNYGVSLVFVCRH